MSEIDNSPDLKAQGGQAPPPSITRHMRRTAVAGNAVILLAHVMLAIALYPSSLVIAPLISIGATAGLWSGVARGLRPLAAVAAAMASCLIFFAFFVLFARAHITTGGDDGGVTHGLLVLLPFVMAGAGILTVIVRWLSVLLRRMVRRS